jgi:hypothetical protein
MLVRKCCIFNGVTYGHDSRHPGLAHSKTLGSSSTHSFTRLEWHKVVEASVGIETASKHAPRVTVVRVKVDVAMGTRHESVSIGGQSSAHKLSFLVLQLTISGIVREIWYSCAHSVLCDSALVYKSSVPDCGNATCTIRCPYNQICVS